MPYYTDIGSIYGAYPAINSAQATGLNSASVLAFIDQVENEINAKVSARYALPVTASPLTCPILQTLSLRESIFRIAIQRGLVHFPPALQGKAPLAVQHDMDQKLLTQIMEGEVNLLNNSLAVIAPSTSERGEIYSTTMNQIPTFHEGAWVDQVQDTDKLDTIESDRLGRGL